MPDIPTLRVEHMIVLPSDATAVQIQFNRALSEAEVGQLRVLLDDWLAFAIESPK